MTLLGLLVGSEEEGEAQLLLLLLSICPSGFKHSTSPTQLDSLRSLSAQVFGLDSSIRLLRLLVGGRGTSTSPSLRPSVSIVFKHPNNLLFQTFTLNFTKGSKTKKNCLRRFECMYFSFTLDRRYWIHLVQQFNHPNYLLR